MRDAKHNAVHCESRARSGRHDAHGGTSAKEPLNSQKLGLADLFQPLTEEGHLD